MVRPVLTNLEDAAVVDRMEVAIARALDAARRAEGLGERDIFLSGWGVISTVDLAAAFRLRADRLKADIDRFVAAVTAKVEEAADAVESVVPEEGALVDGGETIPNGTGTPPRRGPGRPRRSPEPGAV